MYKTLPAVILGIAIAANGNAQQSNLAFIGDFESGAIQKADRPQDGFFVQTLPDPQSRTEIIVSGAGGFGPGAKSDTRVVQSEIVDSETVTPRGGKYFARSALYYNKNYIGLNADMGRDKPRSALSLSDPANRFDYDTETFLGFSIYVPRNYENETGTAGTRGNMQLFVIKEPASASRGFFELEQNVLPGTTKARWLFIYKTNATSISSAGSKYTVVDLGLVDSDRGMWTDFVIRFRENPFSVNTNPASRGIAGAKNQMYEGNKGIIQLWKAEGPVDTAGNRKMELKVDKVNTPVGLVPHATDKRVTSFRIYKHGWKRNPTDVRGPIWFGFDEIRMGFAKDGIGYSDVDPSGRSCTDDCPMPVDAKPKPPNSVDVS